MKTKKVFFMDESLNEVRESVEELNSAFLAGSGAFEKQLAKISDQQYVNLLTLLDDYPETL